ncbi:MAG: L-threonine 3-dehydrogenase [Gammaproteobacteria bacterium]|nr:L-threonine 3-dehydrogenase [Gammaproteobacteria bacterium]
MKALVKAKAEPGIWLQDEPLPHMGINDVLIKIKKTAICGTDLHIYKWDEWAQKTIPVPMIVGHEFVGVIVDKGSEVTGLEIGQRISGEGHITCNHCRNCRAGKRHLCRNTLGVGVNRSGCFAEYLAIPASNVCPLPDDITDDQAAILDPLGNATHTALSFDLVGEDVLITGAGPIGIMAVSIAKKAGARYVAITDVNDYRLNLARQMGADAVINVSHNTIKEAMTNLGMQEGFDVGLEMSGNAKAIVDMIAHLNHGAKMALLGIPPKEVAIDWNQVVFKGLHIKGIYGREMYETWYKMISMLQSGLNIEPIITDHYHIDEYQQAFEKMLNGNTGKVILNW